MGKLKIYDILLERYLNLMKQNKEMSISLPQGPTVKDGLVKQEENVILNVVLMNVNPHFHKDTVYIMHKLMDSKRSKGSIIFFVITQ